jgi:hypothetical protein
MALTRTDEDKNAAITASVALLDGGELHLFGGAVPADVTASLGAATQLTNHALSGTAGGAASGGQIVANAIGNGTGLADLTATFGRFYKTGGTVATRQVNVVGSPTGSTGEIVLDNTSIATGQTVTITSYTFNSVD